jgi:hypothetical protein
MFSGSFIFRATRRHHHRGHARRRAAHLNVVDVLIPYSEPQLAIHLAPILSCSATQNLSVPTEKLPA